LLLNLSVHNDTGRQRFQLFKIIQLVMKPEALSPMVAVDTVHIENASNHTSNDISHETGKRINGAGDVAAELVDDVVAGSITPEQERAVLRRVDLYLMPVMFLSFAFQYMDKACLTGAALFGILGDLKLVDM
jgi:hypothetical protein